MNPKKMLILFGTQTGNAEDVSERIGRQLIRMHIKSRVQNIKDYAIGNLLQEKIVIFVCSTTGNGEFPDNMRLFWKFLLRKSLPCDSLSHLKFCVFGLGDSSYDKFNVAAKKLNKRLLQLGAFEFLPIALGDDQHELGYDAALDPWIVELKKTARKYFEITLPNIPENVPLPPKYKIEILTEDKNLHEMNMKIPANSDCSLAIIHTIKRVTSRDHFQSVNLVQFKIDSSVLYNPGDVAVVFPENPDEELSEFLALLNISPDKKFFLTPNDPETGLPSLPIHPCTAKECAKKYFDFMSIPRRSFFEFFHHFSQDETEKEKLLEFTTPEGQEELYEYCNRPRRTILEVLQDFPHTTPYVPFEYYFDMIPAIRPRSYSIASSLVAHPCEFQLLVAVVKYRTRLQKPRIGLCSNWLANLIKGTEIPFYVKKGSISLPESHDPVIMIGPGTGCAPFRAFIEQRASQNIANNFLFFGCRFKSKDFLCSNTWEEYVKKNLLTIFTAFSRDQPDKIYVQHRIAENGALMWKLIHNNNGFIYVAGNAKQMPQSVKEAFLNIFQLEGGLNEEESGKYLQILEQKRRYQVETWS